MSDEKFNLANYSIRAQAAYHRLIMASEIDDINARRSAMERIYREGIVQEIPREFLPPLPVTPEKRAKNRMFRAIIIGGVVIASAFLIYKIQFGQ